jgi:nitroreductase
MVQNQNIKDRLADIAMLGPGNQWRTKQCSALAVFLADLEASKRISRITQLEREHGGRHANYTAMLPISTAFMLGEGHAATLLKQVTMNVVSQLGKPMPEIEDISVWAYKNTSLLVQQYVLACTSHDIDTAIMEGMDTRRLKQVLRIPDRYGVPMVVATGYGQVDATQQTPRLSVDEVVFQDTFGVTWGSIDDEERKEDDAA